MSIMYATTRTTAKALGLLLSLLLLGSCGVSEPDDSAWQNVADFSWPTTPGVPMKYRTFKENVLTSENNVTIGQTTDTYNFQPMYVLNDTSETPGSQILFLPMRDTLIIQRARFGGDIALVAPLKKGHSWTSGDDVNFYWKAEIIETFSYRKVEGETYRNVVAVKYTKQWRRTRPNAQVNEEWIQFYAQGVGVIMTIQNTYPESTLSDPIPQQTERIVLVPQAKN